MTETPAYDVVVPTTGRASLTQMLLALRTAEGPAPEHIFVVDDRRAGERLSVNSLVWSPDRVSVLHSGGLGPAGARNVGWRAGTAPWVAFLDDDVVPQANWRAQLVRDLVACESRTAASQGQLRVPSPHDRRATDWERNVAGLEHAQWATADMAYRRTALEELGGFDERFPRAYREDADLGLRAVRGGWQIVKGDRICLHPVRPAPWHVSIGKQAGNADDVLMRRLHGPSWRRDCRAPRGAGRRHVVTTTAAAVAIVAAARGHRRTATLGALTWLASTAAFAAARIKPGPRAAREVTSMIVTSAAVPVTATAWSARGLVRARRLAPARPRAVGAVLIDRDGTLVEDVPYNGDPAKVEPRPGAVEALARLRAAGIPIAVVTNQSGVGRGLVTTAQVDAVNARIDECLGPFVGWFVCPHAPDDGCDCRKPAPGLVVAAARSLGVAPRDCAVIGDIGADMRAAHAAGARGVLVPTTTTRVDEIAAAPVVAPDLSVAVDLLLSGLLSETAS